MMANPYDTLSPEDYAQQQQLNRQQKMAEMLMSQTQAPQGQMVSGRYVAPSFFQYITPLVNAYQGKRLLEQGDTKQQALAEAIRGRNATELQDILGKQFGSADYKPAVPYPTKPVISEGSDMVDNQKVVMPPVYNQVGQAPDPNAAFMAASQARSPQGQALFQTLLANKMKPPELTNVAPGGSLVRTKDGVTESVFTAPEKISPTEMQRNWVLAKQQGYPGDFVTYQREVANFKERPIRISVGGGDGGMPNMGGQGGFDKKGNFVAPTGAIFTPVEIRKDREEVGSLINALQSINKISKEDVAASDTILGNVSEGGFKGYVAKQAGLDQVIAAQNKINAAGVMQILNNLPPGPASDKDIAMAKSSFPGYGNAKALQSWIDNTNATLTQKVGNYEQKYGSMNWYGNVNPLQPNTQSGGDFKIKEKGK
jgi:hypothetical protein